MDPRLFLKLAPERRLIMTYALRQSLEILQMTQLELSQWLNNEIEKNPLLEFSPVAKYRFNLEIPSSLTLHEHLQAQIRDHFPHPHDRLIAQAFLEHLDDRGFLTAPLETLAAYFKKPLEPILATLQTFDPPGIFARNLQESLLLQLKAIGKTASLAYQLVDTCFDDLLHGRYCAIKKKLGAAQLAPAMHDLARLSLRPSTSFSQEPITPIHPDLLITKIDKGWTLQINEEDLPQFHIQSDYLDIMPDTPEEQQALRNFKTQAKWLIRSLTRRRKLLLEIGRIFIKKQAPYLHQKGPLQSLTIRELAETLEVHESTLSRALSGKYASTPRGLIPLRALITSAPAAETARGILEKLIAGEDKQNPLTDEQLAQQLKVKGFPIARRTIAKYRTQLKLGSASQRKNK